MTAVDALRWVPASPYHQRSECGRYTVARVNLGEADVYEAWRTKTAERASHVLASFRIPSTSTDERRLHAISAMKERCAEHARACGQLVPRSTPEVVAA